MIHTKKCLLCNISGSTVLSELFVLGLRAPNDGGEVRKGGRGRAARAPRYLVIYKERGISCSAVV